MKKRYSLLLILNLVLLILPVVMAAKEVAKENLFLYDSLQVQLELQSGFNLVPTASTARLKEVTVELVLFPHDDYRQSVLRMENAGLSQQDVSVYRWTDGQLGSKTFGYTTTIKTIAERLKVKHKIPYPLSDISGYEQYTLPSEKIDSNTPTIVAKARELAEGEDDLFQLVFTIAAWVEGNVVYDLNTLTATAAQKASWVLENRQGVCDEMTSLFVAMVRSIGIPARFVSGISYTTSDLFEEAWQPHGWAEVYFPEVGWVPFDITFGQYGYVDVTHIKLRDGFDPAEAATKFEWVSEQVDLQKKPLDFTVEIERRGNMAAEELLLEQEILAPEVGLGSYNLIKGIVKNTAEYYTATTLQLAVPDEVKIEGRNRRTLLLGPREVKETYWIVYINDALNEKFQYEFPSLIYSEKNVSILDTFSALKGKQIFTQEDIEQLTIQDEEKSYSRKVSLNCNYPHEISLGEQALFQCELKNNGPSILQKANFCVGEVCEIITLTPHQAKTTSITVKADTPGWNKELVSAENELIEKKSVLAYVVFDKPNLQTKIDYPSAVHLGEEFDIKVTLEKESFSIPRDLTIVLHGVGFENTWTVQSLLEPQQLSVTLPQLPLSSNNQFSLTLSWKDEKGKSYTDTKNFTIQGQAEGVLRTLRLWINGILKHLYG